MTSHPRLSEARDYIQRLTCYKFVNIDWLEEALWAYPVTMACGRYLKDGNKSLAVVGDAVLNLVVTSECYKPGIIRGDANEQLKALVCNKNLGHLGHAMALEQRKFIQVNPGLQEMSAYMRATVVEAILGVIFKDSDGDFTALRQAVVGFGVL